MAHIILTGATGTAGAGILAYALSTPTIARISILSRRPVKLAENQPKAHVILHKDFTSYPPDVLSQLTGATACIWAQGISSRGMDEEEYTKITVDYPLAAARAFASLGEKMTFVYISGEGAEMDKEGGVMFARIKGQAERLLLNLQEELGSLDVYDIRPGGINPAGNYLAERKPTLVDRSISVLGSVMEKVYKSMVISTESLGKACVQLAVSDGKPWPEGKGVEEGGRLLRNVALRRIADEMYENGDAGLCSLGYDVRGQLLTYTQSELISVCQTQLCPSAARSSVYTSATRRPAIMFITRNDVVFKKFDVVTRAGLQAMHTELVAYRTGRAERYGSGGAVLVRPDTLWPAVDGWTLPNERMNPSAELNRVVSRLPTMLGAGS